MFTNVVSKDKGKTSPSAEKHDLHMDYRKSEEKANKEETIMIPTVKEAVQYSTGHESREVETTSNMVADSPLTYMAVTQESKAVAERFSISELYAELMKTNVVDNPSKPDTQDFQTIDDQANSADIQTKPLKDMQNIQNVTVKRLREIQFSPITFKRRTLSASNVNVTEQIIFSRTVSKRAEEIPTVPDKQKLTEYMELPESYHIGLTAKEDADISVEQAASPVDGQEATSLPQSRSSTLPAESIRTETNAKEECSREKVPGRRKLHYYYDVKEEIGRGSSSFVKRVVNKENGIQCAAKFVTLRRGNQAYEEREILSKLNHTRIACLLDVFETKRTLVLVLEMCSNEGLLDHLFKKNIVAEAEVRNYIQQILEGLHYLHDNNILHLDIKVDWSDHIFVFDR
ncbi:striated muscle preferentially expressed protein kinase-like [Mobula hypostoma]|uniref:striated muscle preferentially expressed protein kinase-like n=1 Tax=Mobula hypostoma TaxID=723540 RepID=UPI002FC36B37